MIPLTEVVLRLSKWGDFQIGKTCQCQTALDHCFVWQIPIRSLMSSITFVKIHFVSFCNWPLFFCCIWKATHDTKTDSTVCTSIKCSQTAYVALTPGSGWYTADCSVTTWAGRCRTGAVETWWKVVSQWVHSHYRCHHAGSQSCDTKAHPTERAIKESGHKVKLQCVTTNKTCTCTVYTVHVDWVSICQHLPFIFFAVGVIKSLQ